MRTTTIAMTLLAALATTACEKSSRGTGSLTPPSSWYGARSLASRRDLLR